MKERESKAGVLFAALVLLAVCRPSRAVERPEGQEPVLTVLYDNTAASDRCAADWGFSALIEGFGGTVLFDAGTKEEVFRGNVEALGIDLSKVNAVVISHDHGDHTGGLPVLLRKKPGIPVHVPAFARPDFLAALKELGGQAVPVNEARALYPGVLSTGDLGEAIHEQALVLDTPRGLVVVTGCAHPGIVPLLERARAIGKKDVWMVLGGFHLKDTPAPDVERIVGRFRELGVKRVGASHCTGDAAIQVFRKVFGPDFVELGAGRRIELGGR
jgi:7,8-dihydropterin-6-yl-methyl-4-(beta-D-ribofuranosyl)aminobenzene 5'-phosphate synthase